MQIRTFEELEIWKTARRLTQEVYALSKAPQFSKDYGLRDPMRCASVSIMSNVAEGFERGGNQEFTQYSMSPKLLAEKSARNFMWRLTKNTSIKKRQTICSP
jgi:four helix bundle protein